MNATLGYVVMGSDVGGYLDVSDQNLTGPQIPFDSLVFARWSEMGALMPLMQLHTRADLMPWTVPTDTAATVALYQYWATLHHQLVPFFYSLAQETYAKKQSGILRPVPQRSAWAGEFRYMLGDAFLVAPILDATGIRDVVFPDAAKYYDWFAPGSDPVTGALTQYDASARDKYPLFVREGALVPMNVTSGQLDVLVYPSATPSTFTLSEDDDTTTDIGQSMSGSAITITLARVVKPTNVRVRVDAAGTSTATIDAVATAVLVDATTRSVTVNVPASAGPHTIVVTTN